MDMFLTLKRAFVVEHRGRQERYKSQVVEVRLSSRYKSHGTTVLTKPLLHVLHHDIYWDMGPADQPTTYIHWNMRPTE